MEAGIVYHVLNRGNGRMRLFHRAENYDAFEPIERPRNGRLWSMEDCRAKR